MCFWTGMGVHIAINCDTLASHERLFLRESVKEGAASKRHCEQLLTLVDNHRNEVLAHVRPDRCNPYGLRKGSATYCMQCQEQPTHLHFHQLHDVANGHRGPCWMSTGTLLPWETSVLAEYLQVYNQTAQILQCYLHTLKSRSLLKMKLFCKQCSFFLGPSWKATKARQTTQHQCCCDA